MSLSESGGGVDVTIDDGWSLFKLSMDSFVNCAVSVCPNQYTQRNASQAHSPYCLSTDKSLFSLIISRTRRWRKFQKVKTI